MSPGSPTNAGPRSVPCAKRKYPTVISPTSDSRTSTLSSLSAIGTSAALIDCITHTPSPSRSSSAPPPRAGHIFRPTSVPSTSCVSASAIMLSRKPPGKDLDPGGMSTIRPAGYPLHPPPRQLSRAGDLPRLHPSSDRQQVLLFEARLVVGSEVPLTAERYEGVIELALAPAAARVRARGDGGAVKLREVLAPIGRLAEGGHIQDAAVEGGELDPVPEQVVQVVLGPPQRGR